MKKEYPLDFMRFYQVYPKSRHAGYVLPFRSWESLRKKNELPDIDTIISAVEAQKKTKQWIDGFVPMMSTWLNQHRWEANIVDNDLKEEHETNTKQQVQDEFVNQQQTLNREILANKVTERDRLVYNITKFIKHSDTKLVGDIANYFGDIISYDDVTFYANSESSVLQTPALIHDCLVDVCGLRNKGNSLERLQYVFDNYRNVLLITLFVRYCDGAACDILPKIVKFSLLEIANARKLVHVLCTPEKCNDFRTRFNLKPYFNTDSWLLSVTPEVVLRPFPELL